MIRTWVAVGAVAAVAVAAAADSLRHKPAPPPAKTRALPPAKAQPDLSGPDVPPPGSLHGTLDVLGADGCRLRGVDLGRLRLGPEGGETACGLWVSTGGQFAVVSGGGEAGAAARPIELVSLGVRPVPLRELGAARGDVSWSHAGNVLAWCDGIGRTQVLDLQHVAPESRAGCEPRFGAGDSLLTLAGPGADRLLRDGRRILGPADLARGFPGSDRPTVRILGYDESEDGTLAVVVARLVEGRAEPLLEVWRAGRLELAVSLALAGDVVELAPGGEEIAVATRGETGGLVVLDLRSGELLLGPAPARGFAWSPDGVWLALATPLAIPIYGPGRSGPAYVLPLGAAALAWR